MSQIVSGYAVTQELLDRLAELLRKKDYEYFGRRFMLKVSQRACLFVSGTVASTLFELLEERGWPPGRARTS